MPDPDEGTDLLADRAKAQRQTVKEFDVFHEFGFADQVEGSGITFRHRPVADVLQNFKMTHYDHGNTVAVADVNGDKLYDILFTNQIGGNELFLNTGGGKFTDFTAKAGIALAGKVNSGAAFADTDNDGDQDLLITTIRGGNYLFANDGQGRFTDITQSAGINVVAHSTAALFFDYDRDGLVDLVICNVGRFTTGRRGPDGAFVALTDAFYGHLFPDRFETTALYKNTGRNRFKDVTSESGLTAKMWNGDGAFADVNGDGWPDLYLLNMQGDDHYFENQGGKHFIEKTDRTFPKTPWGSMGIKFFDYDNDGRLDLLLTDMHSDMSRVEGTGHEKHKAQMRFPKTFLATEGTSIFGNALYHKLSDGSYEEVSGRYGVETFWPWGVSVADFNADGWEDVFVTGGMGLPYRYGINSMLLNNRGEKFLDAEFILGIEPRRGGRTRLLSFEVDCSQPQEEMVANACIGRSGKLQIMGTLSTRSAAAFDLDGDGDLDIVTNDFNSEPMVLVSNLSARKQLNWLTVTLVGRKSNRNGLGAIVRVRSGTRTYTKPHDGKSGYLAQSTLPLYFGLGEEKTIEQIEVDWPSGRKQVLTQKQVSNRNLVITEPE